MAFLDLKKQIAKLNGMFTISQTHTFTACGKDWYFRRIGNVVYFDSPADIRSAASGVTTLGTLPIGMRPKYIQRLHVGNSNAFQFVQINPSGVVQFYTSAAVTSAQNNSFSTSFIAEVGGVVRKLLKALQSLSYRKAVVVC